MKYKQSTVDKDFDYFPLLLILWKEKLLISVFSLLGLCISYFVTLENKNYFVAKVKIYSPPPNLFNVTEIGNEQLELFQIKLYENLLSRDNLSNFLGGEEKLKSFKFEEFKEFPSTIFGNVFLATYESNINGVKLLNDYVVQTQALTIKQQINYLKSEINQKIKKYEIGFEIAKNLGIKNPTNLPIDIIEGLVSNEESKTVSSTYLAGEIILKARIENLKKELYELNNKSYNYKIILDNPHIIKKLNNYSNAYLIAGVILGFLASLLIMFLRSLVRDLKKFSSK